MKIEILHQRDPDGECSHDLWIDGEPVKQDYNVKTDEITTKCGDEVITYIEENVDPGAGHMLSDWRAGSEEIRRSKVYSDAFVVAVLQARDEAEDSPYIEEGDDDDDE